jgi:cytochrome P450
MANKYPPGPKAGVMGMNIIAGFKKNPLAFLAELSDYDPNLVSYPLGPTRGYLPTHPDIVHEVLVKKAKSFNKWYRQKQVFGKFDGDGLVNSDGDFWKRQRKMIQPAFHSKRISAYAQTMVDYTLLYVNRWQNGQTLNIGHEMSLITRDIVTKTLFNADVSAETERIGEIIQIIQDMSFREMSNLFSLPDWLPHKRHERDAMRELDLIISRIITERRLSGEDYGDLLSMMLLAKDERGEGMSDKQVRDEAMTLFIAGHETTATTLAWLWYLVATHPEVEAKLFAEVHALGGRIPTFEDLPNLKYAAMVIKETMRLYPPTWMFPREAAETVEIGGYTLKKGDLIHLSMFNLHRDPRFWENPLDFDPERFAPGREEQIVPYSYFPFGGGPRVCIGNSFAMMEMQLIMAAVLSRYRLTLAEGQGEPELEPLIVLQPKEGIKLRVTSREVLPQRTVQTAQA